MQHLVVSTSIVDHKHRHLFRAQARLFHQADPLFFAELRTSVASVPIDQDGPNGCREAIIGVLAVLRIWERTGQARRMGPSWFCSPRALGRWRNLCISI